MGLRIYVAIPAPTLGSGRGEGPGSAQGTTSALRELPMGQMGWIIKENTKRWNKYPDTTFKKSHSPDQQGSAGWALSRKVKGRRVDPSWGTRLGCRLGPKSGRLVRGSQWMFLSHVNFSSSLFPSLPLSLKINK